MNYLQYNININQSYIWNIYMFRTTDFLGVKWWLVLLLWWWRILKWQTLIVFATQILHYHLFSSLAVSLKSFGQHLLIERINGDKTWGCETRLQIWPSLMIGPCEDVRKKDMDLPLKTVKKDLAVLLGREINNTPYKQNLQGVT